MEENAKIAAQKSGRLSFYVVNAIADGCTINLIVAVAIILLNLYVAVSTGCRLPPLVLSMHFPDVAASIYVEAVPAVPHE